MISSDRMAAVDRNAAALGVPRKQLMESSGNAVARAVRTVADPGASVAVVAGRGNNGGDAFVAVRFLVEYDVTTHLLGREESIATDIARENWDALGECEADRRTVRDSRDLDLGDPDVVVDAMLGTGVTGSLREPERTAAERINATDAIVVAVDVPSGVDADTGEAVDAAVEADRVVTFHDVKPGLTDRDDVTVADIGIPNAAERFVGPGDLASVRDRATGETGRIYVVGGGPFTGAPALAAQASMRAGADLAFVAAPETVAPQIQGYAEDLIVQPYDGDRLTPDQVDDVVDTATGYDDVVVLGPGLGRADDTLDAAREFLSRFDGRAVVDADALGVVPDVETEATLVCTPNERELADLGGPEVDGRLRDVADEIEALAADLGHVVLAKGEEDVVSNGDTARICRAGAPGMTVGGTGDVLAGAVAALLCEFDAFESACVASYAVGRAGDRAAADRGDGLLASDLLDELPRAVWGEAG